MKPVFANLSIVRMDAVDRNGSDYGRSGSNVLPRSNSMHPIKIWRPRGKLVARWHVSPETGRIECRWQREQLPGAIRELVLDDQVLRNEICWSVFNC